MEKHLIHSNAVLMVKGQECKGVDGQFCTMEKHLIHSNPVLRVKGQECKGVNSQGSILYNRESSHPFKCCFDGKGSRM